MKKPVNVKYKPLSPACGAEILGVNLREELPQTTIDEIRALWNKYIVLVFRGQEITEEEQLRFAGRFARLLRKQTIVAPRPWNRRVARPWRPRRGAPARAGRRRRGSHRARDSDATPNPHN